MSSSTSTDVKLVKGNASDEIKEFVVNILRFLTSTVDDTKGFSGSIGARIKITEVSIHQKESFTKKQEATVVCELEVNEEMVNGAGNMHGACSAYLIDLCTSLPLAALVQRSPGVSQVINMIYHAPAPSGTPIRIINKSVAVGGRTMTSRGEIWDTKNERLVASGVHIKMLPSQPKL
ncbi:HotDog domain-containing protein [Gautieria morchelliformis]|nr:HotDog domain-containing protein [Gautieria morchelliformis]